MCDKTLDEHEMTLQEFIIIGFNMTKIISMIYGVSISKGAGLVYSQKPFNLRSGTLIKLIKHSSSSSVKKGIDSYFVPVADKI